MLRDVIMAVDNMSDGITLAANLLTFVGGFYIALHSRMIPKWLTTSLWYIGLAALLNGITFIVQWTWDSTHPLSHFQIGSFTEVLMNVSLATTIGLLFFNTVWKDYLGSKKRQEVEDKVDAKARAVTRKPAVKKAVPVKKTIAVKKTVRRVK